MGWQRFNVKLRKGIKPAQREAIGLEIIEHIKKRTLQGKDKRGRPWSGSAAKYSESYKKSAAYKLKTKRGHVDLDLSSEMLNSMKIISNRSGSLIIGYDKSNTRLNGKVEGNRKGTYGSLSKTRTNPKTGKTERRPVKKRDFLGIERSKLTELQNKYGKGSPAEIKERIGRLKEILTASEL